MIRPTTGTTEDENIPGSEENWDWLNVPSGATDEEHGGETKAEGRSVWVSGELEKRWGRYPRDGDERSMRVEFASVDMAHQRVRRLVEVDDT